MGGITSRSSSEDEEGEMLSRRRAAVLEDDDLLSEILLRLPPQPSSLPRASAVCKRWRRLLSDPRFSRRFRRHHRGNFPLLGFFHSDADGDGQQFVHTLEAPNRVPPGRFSLKLDDGDELNPLGCRHGLLLFFDASRKQILVRDPVTGDQHRVAVPAGFYKTVNLGWGGSKTLIHATVLRAAEDAKQFQVVLAVEDYEDKQHSQVLACIYSSETDLWGNLVSTPIPSDTCISNCPFIVAPGKPARLVGNSLYWLLEGNSLGLLEFDLERQNLAVIPVPVEFYSTDRYWDFMITRLEGCGLGFFFLSDVTAQLWKRTTNGDGVASWILGSTIELDKLLSINSDERGHLWILGYAEDSNVLFLATLIGLFLIHLESLQFKKLSKYNLITFYQPFESVYAAGI